MACRGGCDHVVLVPTPAPGHCIPFLHLASRLAHLGLKVTILTEEEFVPILFGSPEFKSHVSVIRGKDVEVVGVKDEVFRGAGYPLGILAMLRESSEATLISAFTDSLSSLMSSTEYPAPCCIIFDMLAGWTQAMAAKFGIPGFVLYTQSATNLSLMLHVPTLLAEGRLPLTESNQDEPIEIPGLKVPLSTSELPAGLLPGSVVNDSYALYLRMSRRIAEAPVVLVNTFRELEDDVFAVLDELHGDATEKMPKVIPIGPLLPSAVFAEQDSTTDEPGAEELESIMRFLDKQAPRSVLYIAFGSAGLMTGNKQVEEIALGLEASGQSFLWVSRARLNVVRPDAPTLEQIILPPGFLERTKERGMAVSAWAPQQRILQHPATGAFLSHCGWNSIVEGIAAGLPILCWPGIAEQKMNRRFLVDVAKVGAEFKLSEDGEVTRAELERVVRLVMQEEEGRALQSHLEPLKEAAAKSACSVDNLKAFIALCEDRNCKQGCT